MSPVKPLEWRVLPPEAGDRLDRWLALKLPGLSRRRVRNLIASGAVLLDGRPRPGGKALVVRAGQRVMLREDPYASEAPLPQPELDLRVVYEEPGWVVVDKPAPMPTHPLRVGERGTLANALVARYPEMLGVGFAAREPGLLHRLDNETSGLLIAARDAESFTLLREAFTSHGMDKHYLLLCQGCPAAGRVLRGVVSHDPRRPRRVRVEGIRGEGGTEILKVEPLGAGFALVEVRVRLARRHQIRAHLASSGCPLAGDTRYGGPALTGLGRHFLHASRLRLRHPRAGHDLAFDSPLPDDLSRVVARLRGMASPNDTSRERR